MQNPPAYVQVDAAGRSARPNFQYSPLYARVSPVRDTDLSGMPNILMSSPHHHVGHGHAGVSAGEVNASRLQQLHSRLGNPYGSNNSSSGVGGGASAGGKSMSNGSLVPGLATFPSHQHQSRSFDTVHGLHHPATTSSQSTHTTASLNEAFVNSFGLTSSAFLNPYFSDRTRTPSPLHRFLHNQLLAGQASIAHPEHQFIHDDLLLDSGPFRGLNLTTNNFSSDERQTTDPMITSGHLSRSLDDLSVVMDNSNDSVDLSLRRNDSSSPDDSLRNDFIQSENVSSNPARSGSASTHGKVMPSINKHHHRRSSTVRADISRTCPTCGKTFGNSSGLAKHRLTHSDERKYLCSICMKSFKRQDHLSGHLLTHSDKKPFACPVENCGKSYCDSRSLKRHLDQHEAWLIPDNVRLMFNDVNNDDAEEAVSVLDKQELQSFSSAEHLKPFACQICRRRFKNGPALNGHMRLHGGFFNKKTGDFSSPPSVQSSGNMYSAVQSPLEMVSASDQEDNSCHGTRISDTEWNAPLGMHPVTPPEALYRPENLENNPLNHVAVIRHVPPVAARSVSLKAPALPPVSTLASPTNSPTSLHGSFTFYPGPSPPPPAVSQTSALSSPSTLTVPAITGKHRRHSDSDNVVPTKRPCTVTDMLRRTITMNMARKMTSSPTDDGGALFHTHLPHGIPFQITEASARMEQDGDEDSVFPSSLVLADEEEMDDSAVFEDQNGMYSSPISDLHSGGSPSSFVGSLTSGSDLEYPDSPFGSGSGGEASGVGKSKKRKHRPEPLIIPPHGTVFNGNVTPLLSPGVGFSSRLRSPRVLVPGMEKCASTPPPYTPPPMLSPTRRGSGLFWNVITCTNNPGTTTPQSGSRFLLKRSLSSSSTNHLDLRNSISGRINEDPRELLESPFSFIGALGGPPPETDPTPHINVGDYHQAYLPTFNPCAGDALHYPSREDPMWIPGVVSGLTDHELDQFALIGETNAMLKGGQNLELTHHVLFHSAGDVLYALKVLLKREELLNFVARHPSLRTYRYQNSDVWSPEEITAFSSALMRHDKDFFLVAAEVKSKNVRQCVEFFYNWKKMQPDEYKRMKAARRRRQDMVTRSKTLQQTQRTESDVTKSVRAQPTQVLSSYLCHYPSCGNTFGTKQALAAHSRVHFSRGNRIPVTLDMCPPPLPVTEFEEEPNKYSSNGSDSLFPFAALNVETPVMEFPCRICDKVFQGVKSRNAHMKVHRLTENQPPGLTDRH